MPLLLIALAAVLFYLAFSVNVFGFGLMMYDDASEDVFKDLSERRKRRLNRFFSNITRFKYFVQIFNNFALVVIALLIYRVTVHIFAQNAVVRAAITIAAIVLLWLIFLTVVQFFSKRVSARWIVNTLIKKQTLMSLLYGLFTPFILVFMKTLDIYKGEKIPDDKKEELVERAIESMADEVGIEEPLMEEDEKEMIENIFELDQTSVKAVMVPRIDIVSLHSRMGLEEIKEIVRNSGHSRFPVYGEDADDVLGFLYVKDLFCRDAVKDEKFNIREYIRKAYVIPETKRLDELLEELKRSRTHIALVVDEYGGTAGIVTMENIIEVIVGDIQDEHDYEHPDIVRLESGEVRVNANVSVEDLAEYLDIELVDERFETVGGLIYDLAGTLPSPGQVLTHDGLEFVVEKVSGQRIETVKIKIIDQPAKSG
ncbi:MAG TPA: HlyC/CorC family transporter [candidate division Zixibacteria bacterium]|nr:HlyC/CorC family transporter [candidate division Zixibacteria bacterium]